MMRRRRRRVRGIVVLLIGMSPLPPIMSIGC